MKRLLLLFIIFFSSLFALLSPTLAQAESIEPFAPFSVEGNPDEEYHFEVFFPLFKYIRPAALKIFENRDRSRDYDPYMICDGGDQRDYVCAVDNQTGEEVDGCDGGIVAICNRNSGEYVKDAESGPNGSCSAHANSELKGTTKGKCSYKQRPGISRTVKGTDFSGEELVYPKLQNEANAYGFVGLAENPITYGSHQLMLDQGDKAILQLMVLKRAKQTKSTLNITGEWPLGWVDWGYKDINMTKSLIDIHDELPDGMSGAGLAIVEADDDFFLTGGNLDAVSDVAQEKEYVVRTVAAELSKKDPAEWAKDFATVPLYPPSFRQGFVRPTICVWNVCCPKNPDKCWVPEEMLVGVRRGLYYDPSISQAYNASMYELFVTYPLDQAVKIFKDLAATNPLIRFAGSASENAVPSKIHDRLYNEMKDGCLKYVPWSNWKYFTQWIDYLEPDTFLGPGKTCPDYVLQPKLTKDPGGAYPKANSSWFLELFWNGWGDGGRIDEVEIVKYHLITVPEAMGQSISDLQSFSYDTRDSLSELESVKDFNADLSNTVDDEAELLYAGKNMGPADARRRLGYYACDDSMFSAQLDTSIQAYALGTRIGCFDNTDQTIAVGKCDGTKFAQIIADSPWKAPLESAKQIVLSSAMFVNGELNPALEESYGTAEGETGVPCEILAGIHFSEATAYFTSLGGPEKRSNANGQPLEGGQSLVDTSIITGKTILRHPIDNTEKLVAAISNFNGGGNSNCQVGFPAPIPYGGCPREFIGADDPYATNLLDSKRTNMFLLYCDDFTPCIPPKPYGNDRPGAFTAALVVHEYLAARSPTYSPPPANPGQTVASDDQLTAAAGAFTPETCGSESLATALGCLPFTRDAFISALLSFVAGIAGAIALVTMLISTIQIMTAGDDAKKLQAGRDLFFSALTGLLFLIFSVSLLRLIAGDIIKLPGF